MSVNIDNFGILVYTDLMQKDQISTLIKSIGLSEKGATVYCALLELGGAFPSEVARVTKLKRSTVYEVLNDLAIKGLVGELKKRNKYFYTIENPTRLLHLSERAITKAEESNQKLREYLPDLEGLYAGLTNKPKVSYFEGTDGVLEIYADHVAGIKKYEMLGFVNVAELMQFLPPKKYLEYVNIKEKLGIKTRGIIPDTNEDRAFETTIYATAQNKIVPKVRRISKEEFPWKGDITIYSSNKISIVNFSERQISGIIIESDTIHKMMKMIFELVWKGAE